MNAKCVYKGWMASVVMEKLSDGSKVYNVHITDTDTYIGVADFQDGVAMCVMINKKAL